MPVHKVAKVKGILEWEEIEEELWENRDRWRGLVAV
jgi:hypothetical protein